MNVLSISLITTLCISYMLTLSHHTTYLYDTVVVLQKHKRRFYLCEAVLAYGAAYLKNNIRKMKFPYTEKVKLEKIAKGYSGKIHFALKDRNVLALKAELFLKDNLVTTHSYLVELKEFDNDLIYHIIEWKSS